jgi:hypothetical protein
MQPPSGAAVRLIAASTPVAWVVPGMTTAASVLLLLPLLLLLLLPLLLPL